MAFSLIIGTVADDVACAATLLREIAIELANLRLDERAAPLHLKVLALNRVVPDWTRELPSAAHLDAVLHSLRLLQVQVNEVRAVSGVRLRSTEPPPSLPRIKVP